jgi:molecular chaperone DnaK (HSP70)
MNSSNSDWIGCIDFGTTLSKLAIIRAIPKDALQPGDIAILGIGDREGFPAADGRLLPSSVYIHDDRIVFGVEAERDGIVNADRDRFAFTSLKQYLSTHDLSELDAPLPKNIDPTGRYTARIVLKLFLAHLLYQADVVSKAAGVPWPVPLRIARPAWDRKRAKQGEAALRQIVTEAIALAEILGPALSAAGGISHKKIHSTLQRTAKNANDNPAIFKLDETGTNASVLEATAVAAASIKNTGRRIVVVVDIGGGTSDFGAFMTGLRGRSVLAEISGSSQILRKAGDHLDMLLRGYILEKLHYLEDDAAARGAGRELRRHQRVHKEELFKNGTLFVRVGDDSSRITAEEFISSEGVRAFNEQLRETFTLSLKEAVECARGFSRSARRAPVEILFTGGGHALPMVRDLTQRLPYDWSFKISEPNFENWPTNTENAPNRQLVVAVGGAMLDLPKVTAPIAAP